MLSPQISFFVMLAASLGFGIWYGFRNGKQFALGAGMAVSMLAGSWFDVTVFETKINVTMATAIVLLSVYCLHSWREIFRLLNVLDYVLGVLVIWHIVVDVSFGESVPATSAKAYGQWMLPYAAGRYTFIHANSLKLISPIFVAIAAVISLGAIFEAFTYCNLWELLFCEVDDLVTRVTSQRFGLLYRAIGPVRNPIFLGIVLLTVLPLAVNLTSQTAASTKKRIVVWSLIATIVLGIAATLSRGPLLCLPIGCVVGLAYWSRVVRWCSLVATVLLIGICVFQFDTVAGLLDGGANANVRGQVLTMEGSDELVIHTNTKHRLLIPQVYGPIMLKGGPMGYGSERSSGFPPRNLPGLPTDPVVLSTLRNVDNAYINIGLAFGLVGVALFSLLFGTAVALSLRLASSASTYLYPSDARVAVAYAGLMLGIMLEVFTVHWSYDYGFWVLFMIGSIAGLTSHNSRARRGEHLV